MEAMAVISPIVFRNITGLGLEYHSQQAAGSADAVAFNPPVSGCQGRCVVVRSAQKYDETIGHCVCVFHTWT